MEYSTKFHLTENINTSTDSNAKLSFRDRYKDKIILAPMVRVNKLPFRLLCLRYGANLVYSEEIIDYKLVKCNRFINTKLSTIDFVTEKNELAFRTCNEERGRVILQLGSNNPERALKAAKLVSLDVAGIDFNFGCPKSFSMSGGMGAALLSKPDQIESLLKYCVQGLDLPVTCKIRVLDSLEDTLKLIKLIESCGVAAIAVHGRTKDERPKDKNRNDYIRTIAQTISVPVIANGNSCELKTYSDLLTFKALTGASSVMVGRAAMKNPSIFDSTNVLEPSARIVEKYMKLSTKYDNPGSNSKYVLQTLMKR